MNKTKILIAEDEAPARKKLIDFIKKTGIETDVLEAGDGVSAGPVARRARSFRI